jgi:multiple sugar transport system permease protein
MTSLAPGGASAATSPDPQEPARNAKAGRPGAKTPLGQFLFWLMLAVLTVIFLAPLVWMVSTSFKTPEASTSLELSWIPQPWDVSAYQTLFSAGSANPVLRWFFNSMFSAAVNAALIVAVDALAAYALARMDFPGKKLIFTSVITTIFLPAFVFLIPNFLIVSRLGWLDSLWAIIVPSAAAPSGCSSSGSSSPRCPRSWRRPPSSTAPTSGRSSSR